MKKIGKDKYMHFTACAIITIFTTVLFFCCSVSFVMAALAGICTSMAAALGKEYGDKINPNNHWDWKDVLADVLGIVFGLLISLFIYLI